MATTNVPLPSFTATGLLTSSEQAILAGVLADWVAAFAAGGKSLQSTLTSPQGQLSSTQAYQLANFQAMLAKLIAQVDPLTSSGTFRDALSQIYFLTRQAATYATIAGAIVSGTPGQTLAAGSLAISLTDQSLWQTTQAVTFDATTGNATTTFTAVVAGSAPTCAAGQLKIYQTTQNWFAVTSPNASSAGDDVETDAEFEVRRQDSVQIGGEGTAANVYAALLNVAGVTDAYVYNNGSDASGVFGSTNYPIPAHSIYVGVTGGANAAIAAAIQAKLDAGCGMSDASGNGTLVTQAIQDNVNYVAPYPTYNYRWVVPGTTEIYLNVEIADIEGVPATYVTDIQQALATALTSGFTTADGVINLSRMRIGGQIIGAAYKPVVQAYSPYTIPVNIFVGYAAAPTAESVTLGIDQQPVTARLNITVTKVAV
jgi:hypothetical protein